MRETSTIAWPVKAREMHNHHVNSEVWNSFEFRPDDIVIATYAKSGTTWTQQIVSQLIFNGAEDIGLSHISPWVDLRVLPPEALAAVKSASHRRFLKTHLPVDALVFSPLAKYLYIGRDGRDAVWSFYNHHANANEHWYNALNNAPGLVGPRLEPPCASVHDYYKQWFDGDGFPIWPFWENVRSWWAIRDLPNVKLMHFNQMKADLAGSIREIAAFLEVPIDEATFPAIVEHCSFDYMKSHSDKTAPAGGVFWNGGGETFIYKGTNGRWRDILTKEENLTYEARANAELGRDCARWLAEGV